MAGRPKIRAKRITAEAEALFATPAVIEVPPQSPPSPKIRMIKQKIPQDEWNRMTDVEKIQFSYGLNLDQVRDLCSIDLQDADLHELSMIVRIYEVHMKMGRAFARDKSRERETANLLRGVRETLEERILRETDKLIQ